MKEYKAIAIDWLTAREISGGQILIYRPSDQTASGHIDPPSEIYLTRQQIARLAQEFPVLLTEEVDE